MYAPPTKKFYFFASSVSVMAYSWLYVNMTFQSSNQKLFGLCIFKHATGIPCPACGSTRSVLELSKGNISESLLINPLGLIYGMGLVIVPIWILFDLSRKDSSLYTFAQRLNKNIKNPVIFTALIFLIVINWIWNIYKGN